MRLITLHLERYGHFTDKILNFRPDACLHIVYGPNEAGKSSSLEAIKDLFFGFGTRTQYDFVHPGNRLSLGASIVGKDGRQLSFKRRKGNKNAITDDQGSSLPDDIITRVRGIRARPYSEMMALVKYLDGHTPFATKHSVKGDEFENVLVVLGRGWNQYNFDQFLELSASPATIPADKRDFFERNRNLFYVCCSRPTTRLALLFTQVLSNSSLQTLRAWFGADHVHDVGGGQFPVANHSA